VAADEVEERTHHQHGCDEGCDEADGDEADLGDIDQVAVLVEVEGEGAGHGRNGEEEGKFRRW
jgi:hypothetical protein